MRKWIDFFIHRSIFGNLVSIVIIVSGVFAFASMQREAFSKVEFDIVLINTVYPGASPQEVEKLVTIPMEREVKTVEGIKKITSTSLDNRSGIVLQLEPDLSDKLRVLQDIRDATDRAKIEFPEDVEEPFVTELTSGRSPIIEIAMNSKYGAKEKLTEWQLREEAKLLEDEIEMISEVASVLRGGFRDREIRVEVDPLKLEEYNISVDEIVTALQQRNINFPGGTIEDKEKEYSIRTVKEFSEAPEIKELILRQNDFGGAIKIGDVAVVVDDFKKKSMMQKANGNEAIILTVLKKEHADAIDLVDKVKEKIENFQKERSPSLEISTMNDMSFFIRRRLNVLTGNVVIGILMVMISLLFFLGWRVAIMVAFGIPFSFAITFIVMNYFGISVNLISMFGLIIVSGMIVDDAIVVGENIYRLIEKGVTPVRAAVMGAQEMLLPVTAAISTTVIAFMPLMFMGGIMGKFIWVMPAAVIIALGASLVESFFILPSHIVDITRGVEHKKIVKNKESWEFKIFERLQKRYARLLEFSINHRYLVLFLVLFSFIGSIGLIRVTGFSLFPAGNIEIFFIKAETQRGVSLPEMNRRMEVFENAVLELPENELDSFNTRVGIHQENPSDPFTKRGNHYAQIAVYLTPETERERKADDVISYMQKKVNPENIPLLTSLVKTSAGVRRMVINTKPAIYLYAGGNFKKPVQTIPVEADYLAGAGAVGNQLYIYTGNNTLFRYDTGSFKPDEPLEIIQNDRYVPEKFIVSSGGEFGITIYSNGRVAKIDLATGAYKEITRYRTSRVTSLFLDETSSRLFVTTDRGSLEIFDVNDKFKEIVKVTTGPRVRRKNGEVIFDFDDLVDLPRIESGILSQDQKSFYLAAFDGILYRYDFEEKKLKEAFYVGNFPLRWAMELSGTRQILLSSDKRILTYDLERQKVLKEHSAIGHITTGEAVGAGELLLSTYGGVYLRRGNSLSVLHSGKVLISKLQFKQVRGGPPVGDPVSIEIRGDEFDTLLEIASEIKLRLATINGVFDIRDNWETGKEEYHVIIDEKKAALSGISVMQIATTLQTAFDGRVATSIKKMDEEIEVRVIFQERLRKSLASLQKVMVRNQIGNMVPITELATFKKYPGISVITHDELKRTLYVRANIDENKNSSVEVNTRIMEEMQEEVKKYPGYTLSSGGEAEDTRESMTNLVRAAGVAVAGILLVLVMLMGNMRHPRVIMIVIPLGIMGVSVAFFLHKLLDPNLVFSFMATLGVVGLTGVVVNDSIVMVDFINKLRRLGFSRHQAIINAGISRLRPVILTTVTTIFGLIPTAYGIGGNDPFLKPMALAMAWGLFFATVITLIVVPAYYAIWEDRGFVFHSYVKNVKRQGKWDEAEEK